METRTVAMDQMRKKISAVSLIIHDILHFNNCCTDECDPVSLPCGPVNSTDHSNNQRFNINWMCDGENNCHNGYDEKNCPKPDEQCNTQIFTCNDKTKIPYGYVCDERADCSDNEDEIGCSRILIFEIV